MERLEVRLLKIHPELCGALTFYEVLRYRFVPLPKCGMLFI